MLIGPIVYKINRRTQDEVSHTDAALVSERSENAIERGVVRPSPPSMNDVNISSSKI